MTRRRSAAASQRWALGAPVTGFARVAADGIVAAALGDGTVRLLPLGSEAEPKTVRAHKGAVIAVATHAPSGGVLTGGDDGRVCLVSRPGDCREVAMLGSRWVEHLVVDPASGWAAAAMGRNLYAISPGLDAVSSLGESPSAPGGLGIDAAKGRLAVAHYGGVSLTSLGEGQASWTEATWKGSHLAVAISPNGRWLVTATQENALHVWPMDGGEECGMRGYAGKPASLGWSADSQLLLTSGLDSMVGWRFDGPGPRGREPLRLGWGRGGLATCVAAHPAAPAGATGFDNGVVIFADLAEERATFLNEADGVEVTALAWMEGGLALAIGQADGAVSVHDIRS